MCRSDPNLIGVAAELYRWATQATLDRLLASDLHILSKCILKADAHAGDHAMKAIGLHARSDMLPDNIVIIGVS